MLLQLTGQSAWLPELFPAFALEEVYPLLEA